MTAYEDYYEYNFTDADIEILAQLFGVIIGVLLVMLALWVVCYVFQSVSLYTVAKRRGIKNPWLAWLPVGYYWIAGSISDHYRHETRGEAGRRGIVVLVLALASIVLSNLSGTAASSAWVNAIESIAADDMEGVMNAMQGASTGGLLSLLESGVNIALFVFWHMCLFDLYNSCDPNRSVLYLILGVIFGVTIPFFLFACRKKDYGMIQKNPEPEQPAWQPTQPSGDPWDRPDQQ